MKNIKPSKYQIKASKELAKIGFFLHPIFIEDKSIKKAVTDDDTDRSIRIST